MPIPCKIQLDRYRIIAFVKYIEKMFKYGYFVSLKHYDHNFIPKRAIDIMIHSQINASLLPSRNINAHNSGGYFQDL